MAKSGYLRKRDQSILTIIGENIRRHRKSKKITAAKLALDCEMEAKAIHNYEYGKVDISATSIAIIARRLDLLPHELMIAYKDSGQVLASQSDQMSL